MQSALWSAGPGQFPERLLCILRLPAASFWFVFKPLFLIGPNEPHSSCVCIYSCFYSWERSKSINLYKDVLIRILIVLLFCWFIIDLMTWLDVTLPVIVAHHIFFCRKALKEETQWSSRSLKIWYPIGHQTVKQKDWKDI